jgi:predicted nucleic acid-binding protein
MALYFFDSSALVKRYVHEHGSAWVREATAGASGHLIHLSLLTVAELASALARRQREGSLTVLERVRLFGAFLLDCASAYLLLRVEEDVLEQAISLLNRHPLRTADAIQVATAVLLSHTLPADQFGPVIMVLSDDRILQAAMGEGLPSENPEQR